MERKIINKMCCPFDHSDLNLKVFKEENNTILEGLFTCPKCERYYPIITGIPIMSPDEYREPDFEKPFLEKWEEKLPKDFLQNAKKLYLTSGE